MVVKVLSEYHCDIGNTFPFLCYVIEEEEQGKTTRYHVNHFEGEFRFSYIPLWYQLDDVNNILLAFTYSKEEIQNTPYFEICMELSQREGNNESLNYKYTKYEDPYDKRSYMLNCHGYHIFVTNVFEYFVQGKRSMAGYYMYKDDYEIDDEFFSIPDILWDSREEVGPFLTCADITHIISDSIGDKGISNTFQFPEECEVDFYNNGCVFNVRTTKKSSKQVEEPIFKNEFNPIKFLLEGKKNISYKDFFGYLMEIQSKVIKFVKLDCNDGLQYFVYGSTNKIITCSRQCECIEFSIAYELCEEV